MNKEPLTARLARPLLCFTLVPALLLFGCSKASRPAELTQAEGLAAAGKFREAEALIQKVRFRVGIDDEIAKTRERVALYRNTHEGIEKELRASIAERGENKTLLYARKRAREEEAAGRTLAAELWRKRMSAIPEIAKTVERKKATDETGDSMVPQDSSPEALGQDWQVFDRELEKVLASGDYREAIDRLRAIMPSAGVDADRFRQKLWDVQKQGKLVVGKVVQQGEAVEKDKGPDAALEFYAKAGQRFPEFGPLGGVEQARRRLLRALGRADEIAFGPGMGVRVRGEKARPNNQKPLVSTEIRSTPKDDNETATPASDTGSRWRARRSLDKSANRAFAARDYARAAEDWRTAVSFAEGLVVGRVFAARASEAEMMQASVESLAAAIAKEPKRWQRVDLGHGTVGKLLGFENGKLVAVVRNQRENVALKSIPDRAFAALLLRAARTPLDKLGAASLYARAFDAVESEKILADVLREEPRAKPQINALLSSVRKEDPGPGGYVLEGRKFVSSRAIARRELAAEYKPRFAKIWAAKTDEDRNKLLAGFRKESDAVREILVDAVRAKRDDVREALNKTKQAKSLDKLLQDRTALETRRNAALELIFDRVKYFYPYKPPAVSGDKAKEYTPVQMEVDRLCALVREVWDDLDRKIQFSGKQKRDLELYRWLSKALVPLAGESIWREDRYLWALAKDGPTTIRNVARDESERKSLDKAAAVLATNVEGYAKMRADKSASGVEIELMQLTNDYRMRMGRIPLRADARIVKAARDHCEEMSRLGYFGHESPVPSRRSPTDRMRLEGYPRGTGENLAINASPAGAIRAWQRSSGHHRNMLVASHRDIGGGVHGRHYNQNFGAGLK